MNRKLSTVLIIFITTPTLIGVFVSPTDLNTVPKIIFAVLNSIGAYNIRK